MGLTYLVRHVWSPAAEHAHALLGPQHHFGAQQEGQQPEHKVVLPFGSQHHFLTVHGLPHLGEGVMQPGRLGHVLGQ